MNKLFISKFGSVIFCYATSHENNKPDDLEKVLAQTHDELTQAFQETKVEFEQFKYSNICLITHD